VGSVGLHKPQTPRTGSPVDTLVSELKKLGLRKSQWTDEFKSRCRCVIHAMTLTRPHWRFEFLRETKYSTFLTATVETSDEPLGGKIQSLVDQSEYWKRVVFPQLGLAAVLAQGYVDSTTIDDRAEWSGFPEHCCCGLKEYTIMDYGRNGGRNGK
jgi:hypothetical protein